MASSASSHGVWQVSPFAVNCAYGTTAFACLTAVFVQLKAARTISCASYQGAVGNTFVLLAWRAKAILGFFHASFIVVLAGLGVLAGDGDALKVNVIILFMLVALVFALELRARSANTNNRSKDAQFIFVTRVRMLARDGDTLVRHFIVFFVLAANGNDILFDALELFARRANADLGLVDADLVIFTGVGMLACYGLASFSDVIPFFMRFTSRHTFGQELGTAFLGVRRKECATLFKGFFIHINALGVDFRPTNWSGCAASDCTARIFETLVLTAQCTRRAFSFLGKAQWLLWVLGTSQGGFA